MRWKWRFVQSHSNLEHGRGSRVWSQKILEDIIGHFVPVEST